MTCLSITVRDLINILPEKVLRDITEPEAEGLIGISMTEIQQSYFDKIQWKGYRDEVVQNVMEKKGTVRRK